MNERTWVLPEKTACAVYCVQGGEAVRVAACAAEPRAPWACEPAHGLVCWAEKSGVLLRRGATERRIKLARGFEVHALALRDELLFVGGARAGEQLGRIDLRDAAPNYVAMEIPAKLRSHGKSIDAFVFDGERLLALDDFLDPKWFLLYDVSEPRAPRYLGARPLDPDSTGHVIHAAALARRHVVVASTSFNHGRATARLELFERESLAPRGGIYARAREQFGRKGAVIDASGREFAHVDADGERLLLSAGPEGLALADLREIDPSETGPDRRFDEAFMRQFEGALRWLRFPGASPVRGFLLDERRAVVSLRDERGRHEVRTVALPAL